MQVIGGEPFISKCYCICGMCYECVFILFFDISFEATDQTIVLVGGWRYCGPVWGWMVYVVEGSVHDLWFFGTLIDQFVSFIITHEICVSLDFSCSYVV